MQWECAIAQIVKEDYELVLENINRVQGGSGKPE